MAAEPHSATHREAPGEHSPEPPRILARGPWPLEHVAARWSEHEFQPQPDRVQAADAAIAALQERGSPSHDGIAARLAGYREADGRLEIDLEPARWALRLVPHDASSSIAALCVTRSADGRWLAGRRAPWLASWAGRWALGAGGAVDLGENPADTLLRELREEWSVTPDRAHAEALVMLPQQLVMFIGQAWLPEGAEVVRDHEHDDHAWWPADIDAWPPEAGEGLRRVGRWLSPE